MILLVIVRCAGAAELAEAQDMSPYSAADRERFAHHLYNIHTMLDKTKKRLKKFPSRALAANIIGAVVAGVGWCVNEASYNFQEDENAQNRSWSLLIGYPLLAATATCGAYTLIRRSYDKFNHFFHEFVQALQDENEQQIILAAAELIRQDLPNIGTPASASLPADTLV